MNAPAQSTRDAYLDSHVQTATPQRLHLLLIEGAIRFATQSKHHFEREDPQAAVEAIARCRKIVAEMLASVRADDSEIARSLSDIYLFLYRTLATVQFHLEPSKIDEVLRILEIERETWRLVCQKHGSLLGQGVGQSVASNSPSPLGTTVNPPSAPVNSIVDHYGPAGPGFSLEV